MLARLHSTWLPGVLALPLIMMLIDRGALCAGVTISWCSQRFGTFGYWSMSASSTQILLNARASSWNIFSIASLLAHEMCHVRQYRAWGKPGFLCRYSQAGPRAEIDKECDAFDGTVPMITWPLPASPKCFRVQNHLNQDLWTAFSYFSEDPAKQNWESKGWYRAPRYGEFTVCVQRDTRLYIYVWEADFEQEGLYSWPHGLDRASCIRSSPFTIVENFNGYAWWDTRGPLASDTCGTAVEADGYWSATFEFLTDSGYSFAGATLANRRLLSMGADRDVSMAMDAYGGVYGDADADAVHVPPLDVIAMDEGEVEEMLVGNSSSAVMPTFVDSDPPE
eukprot:jgi/Ulvmu1/3631/UM017_0043.1